MNVASTTRHFDFRTRELMFYFSNEGLLVVAFGLCAEAPWADVEIRLTDNGALLRVGNASAALNAQDCLFLKPLIDSHKQA